MEDLLNGLEDENNELKVLLEEVREENILFEREYEKLKFETENNHSLAMYKEENSNLKQVND